MEVALVVGGDEAVLGFQQGPCLLGRLDEAEQVHVVRRDHAGLHQQLEVHQPRPELAPEQQDGAAPRLAGLHQRHHLEQLVERAEAAGKAHQRHAAHEEVHLAQREVVELEAQLGRDVRVGHLLVRQHDVHGDALAAHLEGAAVARFHDAGAAAGDHVHRRRPGGRARGDERCEAARLFVEVRHLQLHLGVLHQLGVVERLRLLERALRHLGGRDARAAEDHHRGADVLLLLDELGLEQLELHAHGAQLLAQQELGVGEGEAVGAFGAFVARRRLGGGGFLFGAREVARGEVGALVHAAA